jgi:hypothetical protein
LMSDGFNDRFRVEITRQSYEICARPSSKMKMAVNAASNPYSKDKSQGG